MIRYILLLFMLSALLSQAHTQSFDAQSIIDRCIQVHGGDSYTDAHFRFDFRDKTYELKYDHGKYVYIRSHQDDGGQQIKDILTNDGFTRKIDNKEVKLSVKNSNAYSSSVNSVNYFVYLPYFLNDAAVIKKFLGEELVKGEDYYKIQVTFGQEGGGEDYEDVYVYWIHKITYTMDYLAYSYLESDGQGVRFRSAYNRRTVGGVVWQDYLNYKVSSEIEPSATAALYDQDRLELLSKIESENVTVIKK